ncbi:MAG: hypothetical protein J3Q66DRAFT_330988 [Benniella sp.]|nr:MAG: hypothetical protein J3Q66DRAFT_330988 [Benniella sp.]
MEKTTPFDIPLLINEICQYLSRKDLTRCVLVSKTWAAWFTPTLWRDLDCGRVIPDALTFSGQREHIRVMRGFPMWISRTTRELLPSLHLQRLEFRDSSGIPNTHRAEIRVLPLLERIPTLQHLQISLSLGHDNVCQQWIQTLAGLSRLESLSLKCDEFVDGKVIQDILRLCHRLERLSLDIPKDEYDMEEENRQEYRDTKTVIERMPEMRLRELSFPSGVLSFDSNIPIVEENIFQPLLGRCPRMEKLDLGWINQESTLQHLSKVLKNNKLPRLRHFIIGRLRESHFQEALVEALSHVECGIESLVFPDEPRDSVIQSLIQHHSRSLTTLNFNCSISLCEFSTLMAGLPNLRSFRSTIKVDRYSRDIPDKHWECHELRILRLDLYGLGDGIFDGSTWGEPTTKRQLDYVFSEVAKLTSLQVLILGDNVKDLYLNRHKYLTQLANLKQLKVFDLAKISHKAFGKQEALWMVKNWPKLLQVYARNAPVTFKEILQEKRPLIEVLNQGYR